MDPNHAKDSMFWDSMEDCPAVYIEGVCLNEGKPEAKAGWAFRYGKGPSQTVGGEVLGAQTALRARIFATISALQWASELSHNDKLVINSTDHGMVNEFYHKENRTPGNENLWNKVSFLMKKLEDVSFDHMFVDDRFFKDGGYFTQVTEKAKHFAALPSKAQKSDSAASGDSNNNLSQHDTSKVHITSHQTDDHNLRAEFKLYYGPDHPGNKTGAIHSELAIQIADLTAFQKALENAIHTSTRVITITTDSRYIMMVDKFRHQWKSNGWKYLNGSELLNKKMIVLIDTLIEKFQKVSVELVQGPRFQPVK